MLKQCKRKEFEHRFGQYLQNIDIRLIPSCHKLLFESSAHSTHECNNGVVRTSSYPWKWVIHHFSTICNVMHFGRGFKCRSHVHVYIIYAYTECRYSESRLEAIRARIALKPGRLLSFMIIMHFCKIKSTSVGKKSREASLTVS